MSHFGSGTEYGLHCLLILIDRADSDAPSSRDLAEYEGISPSYVAKVFTKLEKAGLVMSTRGVRGGYRLTRAPADISVLDVVDAIEGPKPLFQCRDVRDGCILFGGKSPHRKPGDVCSIHAVMLEAETTMRDTLSKRNLADLNVQKASKLSDGFHRETEQWFDA